MEEDCNDFYDHLVINASGFLINPFDLEDEDFDPEIIAQTLSRTCRFWGQTREFYSVAQHCLALAKCFKDKELKKWALIHEVFEGLTGMDVPTPIKYREGMSDYRMAEEKALKQAARIFNLSLDMPEEVKIADKRIMVNEAIIYMPYHHRLRAFAPFKEYTKLADYIRKPLSMEEARVAFLKEWNILFGN
ncbi:hypothetical protein BKH46_08725 [Helicobacter sp. 12S02634-8]|nr:hypothetical protein BKH46_08725 [Helicobacter sp. 12S02634-8]